MLCVQRTPRGGVLHGIEVCCWEVAFDTEDTEAQRTQRKFRYFSFGLSKRFRYLRRTGRGCMRVPATGSKPNFRMSAFRGVAGGAARHGELK